MMKIEDIKSSTNCGLSMAYPRKPGWFAEAEAAGIVDASQWEWSEVVEEWTAETHDVLHDGSCTAWTVGDLGAIRGEFGAFEIQVYPADFAGLGPVGVMRAMQKAALGWGQ